MPVFCLFTLGRHGNFTAGVTSEQPDLLCTALALNIELFEYKNYYRVCRIRDVILELLIYNQHYSYRYPHYYIHQEAVLKHIDSLYLCIQTVPNGIMFIFYSSGVLGFTPGFQWDSCYSIFSDMCNVLQIVVCSFVLFLIAIVGIVLSVLLRFMESDYPFDIFKLFLRKLCYNLCQSYRSFLSNQPLSMSQIIQIVA